MTYIFHSSAFCTEVYAQGIQFYLHKVLFSEMSSAYLSLALTYTPQQHSHSLLNTLTPTSY